MSFSLIKPYFRSRLAAVGFTQEHDEAVNLQNVPATTIDRTFHIMISGSNFRSVNLSDQTTEANVVLTVFFANYVNNIQAIDDATQAAEDIMKSCVKISERVTGIGDLRNVQFVRHSVEPLTANTQDQIIMLQVEFTALLVFNID